MMEILLDIHLRINQEKWGLKSKNGFWLDIHYNLYYKYMDVLYNDEPGDLPSGKLTKLSNIIIFNR